MEASAGAVKEQNILTVATSVILFAAGGNNNMEKLWHLNLCVKKWFTS